MIVRWDGCAPCWFRKQALLYAITVTERVSLCACRRVSRILARRFARSSTPYQEAVAVTVTVGRRDAGYSSVVADDLHECNTRFDDAYG
jgi:hypothetical protein